MHVKFVSLLGKHFDSCTFFLRRIKIEILFLLIILLFAGLLRLPEISKPHISQYDEITYADFVILSLNAIPFFDIHPPFARMIFSEVARQNFPFSSQTIPLGKPHDFGDFPYVPLRFSIAILGTLLPVVLYLIGRAMRYNPSASLVPALFATIDGALIIYSRTILPDTILLLCSFLALLFAVISTRVNRSIQSYVLIFFTGIFLGLALSVKWIALGMFATIFFLFLLAKNYRAICISGGTAIATYLFIFVLSFMIYFPNGGPLGGIVNIDHPKWITELSYPESRSSIIPVLQYLPKWHATMLRANTDYGIMRGTPPSPSPIFWPFAYSKNAMIFFADSLGHKIVLQGNTILWILCFFLFLLEVCWVAMQFIKTKISPIDQNETVLLAGYVMNFLPFFFITRPMYLYHYFTALIFLFLLAPRIITRVNECIVQTTKKPSIVVVLNFTVVLLICIYFLLLLPTVYDF